MTGDERYDPDANDAARALLLGSQHNRQEQVSNGCRRLTHTRLLLTANLIVLITFLPLYSCTLWLDLVLPVLLDSAMVFMGHLIRRPLALEPGLELVLSLDNHQERLPQTISSTSQTCTARLHMVTEREARPLAQQKVCLPTVAQNIEVYFDVPTQIQLLLPSVL
jgi:hypothetical protein